MKASEIQNIEIGTKINVHFDEKVSVSYEITKIKGMAGILAINIEERDAYKDDYNYKEINLLKSLNVKIHDIESFRNKKPAECFFSLENLLNTDFVLQIESKL